MPPIHPLNESVQPGRKIPSRHAANNTASADTGAYSLPSLPSQPAAVHQHGYDGHHSIDHPNDRPRAQHRSTSAYGSLHSRSQSRSHHSHYEEVSDRSFRSGPSAESGSSSYTSTSRGSA
jgi:aquaporin related protein